MIPRSIRLAAFLLAFGWSAAAVLASPDCCMGNLGIPLARDFYAARAVLLCHVEDAPRVDDDGVATTEIVIDRLLKPHDFFKGKTRITLPRRRLFKAKFLLFCDFLKGPDGKERLDVYRGLEIPPGSNTLKYIDGAVANLKKSAHERLLYSFDHLGGPESEVTIDAYREFSVTPYKDYKDLAQKLPADKIAGWFKDPKTPPYRLGLYASLLGACGTAEHAKLLRARIDESLRRKSSDFDGLLQGYMMLQPKEGWALLRKVLRDDQELFVTRFCCLRTANFLRDRRPDLIDAKELNAGVALMLDYPDMADFGIEFLRKANAWDRTDQVIGLFGKRSPGKNFDNSFTRRAILQFALVSTDAKAAAFVQRQRQRDPEAVSIAEDQLKIEKRR